MKQISDKRPEYPIAKLDASAQSAGEQNRATKDSRSRRGELLAIVALIAILIALPVTLLGYQFVLRPALADVRTIDIVAAAPEAGGFQPDAIRVPAGETVRLRFSVPDVTHGIAIGPGLDLDLGHVDPGQVKEVEVTFPQPGRYTFYCNSWCSPNHWRMRGTIQVYDPQKPDVLPASDNSDPVLESLAARGVDIDAPHEAQMLPSKRPSAERGAQILERIGDDLSAKLADPKWRRAHSPVQGWTRLVDAGLDEAEAWDAIAYLWMADMDAKRLKMAGTLYAKNCAACHGEEGEGPGLVERNIDPKVDMTMTEEATAFDDAELMLGGSSDVYYAKLRRGGMGTGMPSFGPIFTPDKTWMLVDYLWTFVFEPDLPQEASVGER
jgi:plastocyanin/mono/diheme cytochrome c family protein